jgi:hypothetical protein
VTRRVVKCSIPTVATIFDNTIIGAFPRNSMESMWPVPWDPYGMLHNLHLKFIEIPWNPHGPVHGIHMECTIPWTFHKDSIVGME